MPVPKRKTSKSRRDQRQSCKFIRPQAFAGCSNCSEPTVGHCVCVHCGFYKGKQVLKSKLERAVTRRTQRETLAAKKAKTSTPDADQEQ